MDTPMISEKEIKQYSLIGDNLDGKYLMPVIETAQLQHLQPTIGTQLYKKLLDGINEDNLDENYANLLNEYIKPYLIHQVLSDIIIPIQYKFRNAGMVGNMDDRLMRASENEIHYLQQYYENNAHFYANRLFDYLVENNKTFKEFRSCKKFSDMHANRNAGFVSPLYLGPDYLRSKCKYN